MATRKSDDDPLRLAEYSSVPPISRAVPTQWDSRWEITTQEPWLEPTRSVWAVFQNAELMVNSSPMLKPFLPTSTKWLGPDFSITVIVFTGPSVPEPDATANAPPPTTNATTPATPAVVRSFRSMISSPR